ncbi:hypothetical protein RB213_005325 [Colletotrichum asianum]
MFFSEVSTSCTISTAAFSSQCPPKCAELLNTSLQHHVYYVIRSDTQPSRREASLFDLYTRPPTTCTFPIQVQLHLVASGIFTDIPCVCKPTARIDAALEKGNNVAVASPVCQASSFSNLVNGACGSASPVPTTDNAAVSSHTTPLVALLQHRSVDPSTRRPVDLSPVLRPSCHAPSQKGNPIKDPGRLKFEVLAYHQHHPVLQASRRSEARQRHGWSTRQKEERWSCRGLAASSISSADPSSVEQLALVDHDDPAPRAWPRLATSPGASGRHQSVRIWH